MRSWRITYLPTSLTPRVTEWVFQGSEFDLNEFLNKNLSCGCSECEGLDWWHTAQACEYEVIEIEEKE